MSEASLASRVAELQFVLNRAGADVARLEGGVREAVAKSKRTSITEDLDRVINRDAGPKSGVDVAARAAAAGPDVPARDERAGQRRHRVPTPGPGAHNVKFTAVWPEKRAVSFGTAARGAVGKEASASSSRAAEVQAKHGDGLPKALVAAISRAERRGTDVCHNGDDAPAPLNVSSGWAAVKPSVPGAVFGSGRATSNRCAEESGGPGLKYAGADDSILRKRPKGRAFGPGFGEDPTPSATQARPQSAGGPSAATDGRAADRGEGSAEGRAANAEGPATDDTTGHRSRPQAVSPGDLERAFEVVLPAAASVKFGTAARQRPERAAYEDNLVLDVSTSAAAAKRRPVGGKWGRAARLPTTPRQQPHADAAGESPPTAALPSPTADTETTPSKSAGTKLSQSEVSAALVKPRAPAAVIAPLHRTPDIVRRRTAASAALAPGPGQYNPRREAVQPSSRSARIAPATSSAPSQRKTPSVSDALNGIEDVGRVAEAVARVRNWVRNVARAKSARVVKAKHRVGPGAYDIARGEAVTRQRVLGGAIAPEPKSQRRLTDAEVKEQLRDLEEKKRIAEHKKHQRIAASEAKAKAESAGTSTKPHRRRRRSRRRRRKGRQSHTDAQTSKSDEGDGKSESHDPNCSDGKERADADGKEASDAEWSGGRKHSEDADSSGKRGEGKAQDGNKSDEDSSDSGYSSSSTGISSDSDDPERPGVRSTGVVVPDPNKLKLQHADGDPKWQTVKRRPKGAIIMPKTTLKGKYADTVRVNQARKKRAERIGYHKVQHSRVEPRVVGGSTMEASAAAARKIAIERAKAKIAKLLARPRRRPPPGVVPGDFVGAAVQPEWAERDLGRKELPKWTNPDEGVGAEARQRRAQSDAAEAARREWLPHQVHSLGTEDDAADKQGGNALAMSLARGRDVVSVRNGKVRIIPFASATDATADGRDGTSNKLGPGRYSVEDPELLVQFGAHRRAPAAAFGAGFATGRDEATGPYGQRPEAYRQQELEMDGVLQGDVLSLSPGSRPDAPAVPTFKFSELPRSPAGGDKPSSEGEVLLLDPTRADRFTRPEAKGHRWATFDKQLPRYRGDVEPGPTEGDLLVLDVNRQPLEPRAPAAEFGKAVGRETDHDPQDPSSAHDGDVLVLDTRQADERRRRRAKGWVDMGKAVPRWPESEAVDDCDPRRDTEYDVDGALRALRKHTPGVVPYKLQPERWDDADLRRDDDAGGVILDPKFDVGRPRRSYELGGAVDFAKAQGRWATGHAGRHPDDPADGDRLVLQPKDDLLRPRQRGAADMSLAADRWREETVEDTHLILDSRRGDDFIRPKVVTGVAMDRLLGRTDRTREAGAEPEGDTLQLSPKDAGLSHMRRSTAGVDMARATTRTGKSAARDDRESGGRRAAEKSGAQRGRTGGREGKTRARPQAGKRPGKSRKSQKRQGLAPPASTRSPARRDASRARSRRRRREAHERELEKQRRSDSVTRRRSKSFVNMGSSGGRDDWVRSSRGSGVDAPAMGDVLQLSPRDAAVVPRVRGGAIMKPPSKSTRR